MDNGINSARQAVQKVENSTQCSGGLLIFFPLLIRNTQYLRTIKKQKISLIRKTVSIIFPKKKSPEAEDYGFEY